MRDHWATQHFDTPTYFQVLSGHGDVTAGVACTNRDDIAEELAFTRNAEGTALAPFEAWLLLRGLKTLSLRVAKHCENAKRIVEYLRGHDRIARVHYPGFGAIVSFELEASVDETIAFTRELRLWTLAESLGSVKSLFCHPPSMTHRNGKDRWQAAARSGLPAARIR